MKPLLRPLVGATVALLLTSSALATPERVAKLSSILQTHDSFKVRATAAVALGRMGDPTALDPLVRALGRDGHFAVRAAAASALGRLAQPGGVPPLLMALKEDEDPFVHKEVGRALDRHHAPQHLEGFEIALDDDDPAVRLIAVEAFGEALTQGHDAAILPVLSGLADEDASVKSAAQQAIDRVSHDRAIPLLLGALSKGTPDERGAAAMLLTKRTDDRNVAPLLAALAVLGQPEAVRIKLRAALKAHTALVDVAAVRLRARGEDTRARVDALRLLAAIQDKEAPRLLREALSSPVREVRAAAARGAADLATPEARGLLQSALKSEADARVKRQIELVLRTMR